MQQPSSEQQAHAQASQMPLSVKDALVLMQQAVRSGEMQQVSLGRSPHH